MTQNLKRLFFVALLGTSSFASAAPTAFTGLTLIDPVGETRTPDSHIVVDGNRIVAIGTGAPPASIAPENLRDMSGRFALAGLFDTHAHISIGPMTGRRVNGAAVFDAHGNDSLTRHSALMLLAHGVTTIRDPGGDAERLVAYRDAVERGDLVGPEARVAGEIIHRSPFAVEGLITPVTESAQIPALIRRQAEIGVDYIKLYEGLTPEDLAVGVAEARRHGLGTIAHLSDVSWTQAAELGIDALVHAIPISPHLLPQSQREPYVAERRTGSYPFFEWFERADLDSPEIREMIRAVAQREIHFDATMIAFQLAFWGDDIATRDRDVASAHPEFVEHWRNQFRFDVGWQPSDYQRAKAIWPKLLQLVRMMHEAGVPMTIGTDMNNPFVAPGASLAREMQLHAEAGIANWAILRMATSQAAGALGLEERTGRLQTGLEADIVFLAADPSLDLSTVASPVAVVSNGQLHEPADLRRQATSVAARLPAEACGDTCTPESVISALYEAVTAAPGAGWDRARLQALFHPEARLTTAIPTARGARSASATIDSLVADMERSFRASGFSEREFRREVRTFGDFASVYSGFAADAGSAQGAPMRGLNHFQLLRSAGRWAIVSNLSMMEGGGWSLPPRFAPAEPPAAPPQ